MRKGIRIRNLPASLLVFAVVFSLPAQEATEAPARFNQVGEIVDGWSQKQHLWVNGKLPVSDSHLADLEVWLSGNAPNWTVVLMQNARGQSFQNHRGLDAVEHALGKQLANQTAFGNLKDPRTGQSNGAFFILFLEERKFSYYGSDAFDKRSLGENRWVGQLDKPAIAAMRGGGRIVDAVKDTITGIETQLTRKIQSEEAAKKRAVIERERAIDEARQLPAEVNAEIARIQKVVTDFKNWKWLPDQRRAISGDLLQLPVPSWQAGVKAIEAYADQKDPEGARKLSAQILGEIQKFDRDLTQWKNDSETHTRLLNREFEWDTRLSRLESYQDDSSARGHLARGEAALEAALENYELAESVYRDQYEAADQAFDLAGARIGVLEAAVIAEERRKKVRTLTIRLSIIAAIVLFFALLVVLNRLRVPDKKKAGAMLRTWKAKLEGKFDRLFQLMDRASVIVGPSAELDSRGLDGETLSLCRETIREVDELFIMSAATDSVIDRVEKLVETDSIRGGLVNGFSTRRYRKAVALLGSQPIGFDRDQGLQAILEPAQTINPEAAGRSLLGDPEDYEPFRMSFEQLITAYDEKQAAAVARVDRLEHCIDGLPLLLEKLSAQYDRVSVGASTLAEASPEDGFFPMENLRNELLPAAAGRLETATQNGRTDPVTAMEDPAAEAQRQLDAAERLTTRLERVRAKDFIKVEESARQLEARNRKVAWIDERYAVVSNQAEQIATLAVSRDVADDLSEFEDDLLRLRGRVKNCANSAKRAEEDVNDAIEACLVDAEATRTLLAETLKLSQQDVLSEDELSPFVRILTAQKELDAARAALDRGNIEAAQEDFAEIEKSLEEAAALLSLSREVSESHGERHEALEKALSEAREQRPGTADLLNELIENYDPAVLRFSTRAGQPVRGQDSIHDSVDQAETKLDSAESALGESLGAFTKGQLIGSAGFLERAGNEIGFARHQLSLVEDQHAALKKAESENIDTLAGLQRRHEELAESIGDRRTMPPTIEQHRTAGDSLKAIESELSHERPNPFAAMLALEKQDKELNAIEQGIDSDRELFESATAATTDAGKQLSLAEGIVQKAHGDRIPDSQKLKLAIERHDHLGENLSAVQKALEGNHGDWPAVQESATAIAAEIAGTRGVMASELRAAQQAAAELKRAAATIAELQGWRSFHRVSVNRRAGNRHLEDARYALSTGNYAASAKLAGSGRGDAQWELNRARNEERKEVRAAERRKRQRAVSFSVGSSSNSFGSGGSSFGGGGGSSGFSSGSFSSGSGVSRSGW